VVTGVYLLVLIWLAMTIVDYIMIVAVTTWYFNDSSDKDEQKPRLKRGIWWSLRYNFGSLVLGSLVLSWLWIFRAAFNYILDKVTDKKGRIIEGPVDWLRRCLKCFLDCHIRFVKYSNINAYC
jgi:hypothetical protein